MLNPILCQCKQSNWMDSGCFVLRLHAYGSATLFKTLCTANALRSLASAPNSLGESHGGEVWPSPTHDVLSQTWKFTARHTLASRPNPELIFPTTHTNPSHTYLFLLLPSTRAVNKMATRRNAPSNPKDEAPVPTDKSMFTACVDTTCDGRLTTRSARQAGPSPS